MSRSAIRAVSRLLENHLQFTAKRSTRSLSTSLSRCRAQIIPGAAIAKQIKDEVKADVERWIGAGNKRPHLSVILVGDNPASHTYVRNKIKACTHTGISNDTIVLPDSIAQQDLLREVDRLNGDPNVDGILVQLPVPPHISERAVCDAVAPHKDVDGFHVVNVGRFCVDLHSMLPCTPAGVMELIRRTGIETFGKNAVVCGRSKNVGMPIAMLLHSDGIGETKAGDATTTLCHRYTPEEDLRFYVKNADILVVATGIPGLIKGDMVKDGVAVIDVGINRITCPKTGKPKLVGDVDFDSVAEKASYITPVPGGVGPMTVAMLMKNTLTAARKDVHYDFDNATMVEPGPATVFGS